MRVTKVQVAMIHELESRFAKLALIVAAAALGACSSGSGADTLANVAPPPPGGSAYSGPPPETADVQAFKLNLWDNISGTDRCGACHSNSVGQSPLFARSDDINLAYLDANGVVTLASPEDSQMVSKVGGGHNCWLSSADACASILTTWITNWAGDLVAVGGREIELEAPTLRDPGQSKNFPALATAGFSTTVYPLLEQFCSQCHASSAPAAQSPFFAEGPPTDADAVDAAYAAARSKINLDSPIDSRFVVRLRDEFHNCWTSSCASDANAMQAAIQTFADGIAPSSIDPNLVTSKALTLYEGTIASGGNRYEASTIALWEFKTGQGATAFDTSGVEPAMDLTLSGAVEWFGGWGLNFNGGKAQASTAASAKLHAALGSTGEYSIEAWVAPGNVVQEDSRIVSYSAGTDNRNFNLGQTMYNYDFFARTSNSDANGNPQMSTPDADEVLQATLQHVVATFHPVDGRRIYVNGVLVAQQDPAPGGNLSDWDDTYAFVLGNEVSSDRTWQGVVRLVAIHNRVLNEAQILQNFEAGVGERFFLLFGVEHLTSVPDSYVVFEAAQFDSYAYLFREPFFISLEDTAQPNGIDVRGIRIGMNGLEAPVGQSFARVDTTITNATYSAATGQSLASLGGVLPLQKGPELDEFFLTFDALGANTFSRPPPVTPAPPVPQDLPEASDIGVRTFDEINATMAAITGVSPLDSGVQGTYNLVRQSLPAVESAEAVLASHQTAIAQLAIEYCNALVESTALRTAVWGAGFNFAADVVTAFPGPGQNPDPLYDPLLDRLLGATTQIETQPDRALVKAELDQLVYGIPLDANRPGLAFDGGDQVRTRTIAKSACSAVLGSAAMLLQ